MNIEKLISDIIDADECEIMEFDFDPIFDELRGLKAKLDAAEAHIGEFRKVMGKLTMYCTLDAYEHEACELMSRTPYNSLAKVQADTITKLIAEHSRSAMIDGSRQRIIELEDAEKFIDELLGDT